ncbi:bacillithiol biosynthesis cysteine-adding enzyme BshC [Lutibacter sp.]|uniref:bacillithiol biosynthesis cysteine-adding enzyme BshC n=1 Tax=Lutibacter sp. TaxID=1925666 RepID=UPI0035675C10
MKVHQIPFKNTGYFSNLIIDYLDKKTKLSQFYGNFPNLEGFKNQLKIKEQSFKNNSRVVLKNALENQYKSFNISELTNANIQLLENTNTFTIVTGHQLNIFTGPLYFLYKIVSTINLTKQLSEAFPNYNFIPVYWMATEDHDFDEINYFNFKGKKVVWNRESSGAVGRLKTDGFDDVFNEFSKHLGNTKNAKYLQNLFKEAYVKHTNLTNATRYLVNELFGKNGLVIVDGDDVQLKQEFAPIVKDELLYRTSFNQVSKTNNILSETYKIQVNPREINLFYLKDAIRERIVFEENKFKINGTSIAFSEEEILIELENYPERFSPNVIMRPVYQETILPNLCYIGGGGELAYWFQLKDYFKSINTPFPVLLLRNSVLLIAEKQLEKAQKLNVSIKELFLQQEILINKKVKEISEIDIDFSKQKIFLQEQFTALKELAKQTDVSFVGAVNAQETKQIKGLINLEKRLLKAQKRKLSDEVTRLTMLQDELFPKQSLEERTRNFSEYYLELGEDLIPMLFNALNPLDLSFSVIEY